MKKSKLKKRVAELEKTIDQKNKLISDIIKVFIRFKFK